MSSEALLATESPQPQDATTTQGEAAQVDTQPAPEQTEKPTAPDRKDVAETLYPDKPKEGETEAEPKPEEGEGEEKTEEQPEGAPELYEFEVPDGLPEGFEMDEAVVDALAEVSRELDLSQTNAQKLIDKVWPVIHRRAEEQQTALHEQWNADTRADKEIGGQKLDENLGIAKKALDAFGNDGLRELLNGPLGSHPEVVRFLWRVGQTVSEDKFVGGKQGQASVDPTDRAAVAKVLYPNSA